MRRADHVDVRRRLDTCLRLLGADADVEAIETGDVIDAVQARRDEMAANAARDAAGRKRPSKTISPTTVNRDIIEHLRPVLRYAKKVWGRRVNMPEIDWAEARLKETHRAVREEYDQGEIDAWMASLTPVEMVFLDVLMTYGPRYGEMFFAPAAVEADDPTNARLRIGAYKGRSGWRPWRKAGGEHVVPLVTHHAVLLREMAARAHAAGLETIWFDVEPVDGGPPQLYEIGYHQMYARLRTAAKRAGLRPGRLIHGTRHHAGTQTLRATGNLRLAQKLLGHANIATTQRYAHATEDDLRGALTGRTTKSPTKALSDLRKSQGGQGDE
jgi:integrase